MALLGIPESSHVWIQNLAFRLSSLALFKHHLNTITLHFLSFKKFPFIIYFIVFMCIGVSPVHVWAPCARTAGRDQKRASDPL